MNDDVFTCQRYRTLTGSIQSVPIYRRNGRIAANFRPADTTSSQTDPSDDHAQHGAKVLRALSAGLTRLERRTWWRILDGWSVDAIADADGVSRTAIYCRIRGKHGNGGMASKNTWVSEWWARRQHEHP